MSEVEAEWVSEGVNMKIADKLSRFASGLLLALMAAGCATPTPQATRGTGDLGVVIERASGRVAIVDTTHRSLLGAVDGLGDLSHASVVFSRASVMTPAPAAAIPRPAAPAAPAAP